MIRRASLALWAALAASAASAETVTVRSGDHAEFARIVLQHAGPIDWTFARTETGYVFRPGRAGIAYDLSQVWRLIGRDRLADLRPAARGDGLEISMTCTCHALPFEIRPGVVVIDVRDGPPPPGSSFELPEGTTAASDPVVSDPADRAQGGYNWLDLPAAALRLPAAALLPPLPATPAVAAQEPSPAIPAPEPEPDLSAMREVLLRQVGRGMTQGTLNPARPPDASGEDLAPSAPPVPDATANLAADPGAASAPLEEQIRILDPDGDPLINDGTPPPPADTGNMTAVGADCLPDQAMALQDWGAEAAPAQTLGTMSTGLVGEFDQPDPAAVRRAVRYLLHLGFGAEARQLADGMAPADPDRPIWASLARILDGATDPEGAFAGMEVCDTAAALWSLLAAENAPVGPTVASNAALRAFSALPPHLRRHLGPALADRFTARGDETAVQTIRDAILRAPGDPGDPVRLMEAERALSRGEAGSTEALTDLTAATGATAVEATVSLLRDAAARGAVAPDSLIEAAEAMRREYRGASQETDLAAALALAQAAAGQFETALALAQSGRSETLAEVWAMLGAAPDSQLLHHGILAEGATPPPLPPETDRAIARRLIQLGFSDPALAWLGPARRPAGLQDADRLLIAEAALVRRDAAAALRALEGLDNPGVADLRQRAALLSGELPPQDASPDTQFRLAMRAQDWRELAANGPEIWRNAATRAVGSGPAAVLGTDAPTLAGGRALLAESAEARAVLRTLLDAAQP